MPLRVTFFFALCTASFFAAPLFGGEPTQPAPDAKAVTIDLPPDNPPAANNTQKKEPRAKTDPETLRPRAALADDPPAEPVDPDQLNKPKPPPPITTTDPEFQRPRVIDTDEAVTIKPHAATEQKTPAPFKVQAGDPEKLRRFDSAEDVAGAVQSGTISVLEGVAVRKALNEDRPRFPKGEGLDDDGADAAARAKLARQNKTAAAKTPDGAPVAAAAEPDTDNAELVELPETSKKARGGDGQFNELVDQMRKNKELARKISGEKEPEPEPSDPVEREKRRAERAAHLLEALSNGSALTVVSGTITDGSGKVPIAARVKIIDAAGAPVQTPLEDGFYARGQFAAETIPGLTKFEIQRGRFSSSSSTTIKASGPANPPIHVSLAPHANLNFTKSGWYIADLDIGLRTEPGERPQWRGDPPKLEDLLLAAEGEGVHAIGVQIPRDDPEEAEKILALAESGELYNGVLVLPTFPGPRHVFQGVAYGLGVKNADLPWEINDPGIPLREALEDIRAQGGLGILKNLNGYTSVDIKNDLVPLIPQLQNSNYFRDRDLRARLYAAAGLPFETITGQGYDALAFDGSPEMEQIWFNLLNLGHEVPIVGAAGGSLEGGRRPYGQTLVYGGPKLTRASLLDGIKRGKTMVSYGPAVFARVIERDKTPGDWLPADGRKLTLQIQAYSSMLSGMQLDRVEIIRNGKVLHTQPATEGETALTNLNWSFVEDSTAWYVLRVTERRNTANGALKGGTAWSSPIYFRGASHAPKQLTQSRITGMLRKGLTPIKGTVTLVVPGEPERQFETKDDGSYSILIPSHGALVFAAPGCEPVAKRVCEHSDILRMFGELQAERNGPLLEQLAKPHLLSTWRLQLSELTWDITLEASK